MKKMIFIFMFFMFLFLLYVYVLQNYKIISRELEISIPLWVKIDMKDTHGGFHNDGEAFAAISLTKKQVTNITESIQNNSHWRQCPMTPRLEYRITEGSDDFYMAIPKVQNGYWIFKDHHTLATNIYNELDLFTEKRYSYNFSVGILDLDTNILYYYRLDT